MLNFFNLKFYVVMENYNFITIDEHSRVPKYKQIAESIGRNVSVGNLKFDQKIPSINMISEDYCLSRDTVRRAYDVLKEKKIITSIQGKGYFISATQLFSKIKILFLMNKLSSYKMLLYDSFIDNLGPNSYADLHIYHCDEFLFLSLLEKHKSFYDYYVIMPHFKTGDLKHTSYTDKVIKAVREIPSHKLIIMDNVKIGIGGDIVEIYQDFENDIYNALSEAFEKIKKYQKIILVYPEKTIYPYPKRILHGFKKFCFEYQVDFEIINEVCEDMVIKKRDLFIVISESDLVIMVKQIRDNQFELGKDVGVVSYNDTPLKALLGISVMSTDFKFLGKQTANMILENQKGRVRAPFNFIFRDSI